MQSTLKDNRPELLKTHFPEKNYTFIHLTPQYRMTDANQCDSAPNLVDYLEHIRWTLVSEIYTSNILSHSLRPTSSFLFCSNILPGPSTLHLAKKQLSETRAVERKKEILTCRHHRLILIQKMILITIVGHDVRNGSCGQL